MDAFEPLRELDFATAVIVVDAADAVATYGDPDAVYPWASVSKLASSYACLIAVDAGAVSLDDPAGPEGSTLRHLLSHASGLPFDGPAPIAAPGSKRVYSNTGIELAAAHVERAVGMPFAQWLGEKVLDPLGMDTAELAGSPAHAMRGAAVDLAELARGVLNRALLSAELFEQATHVVFPGLPGVVPGYGRHKNCDWGLGFEIRDHKTPHWTGHNNSPATFGHFGMSGSFLWVDPQAHLGAVFLGEREFGDVHKGIWPDLNDRILAAYAPVE